MNSPLRINIMGSTDPNVSFDKTSTPLIIGAFEEHGHNITMHSAESPPSHNELLDCDVFIDRSPINDVTFFKSLAIAYRNKRKSRERTPLMIDNPLATIIASDKRKTHALFPRLVPESYNLDGVTNHTSINTFVDDECVVIKDPLGWYSIGTELLSPEEAHDKYGKAADLIVQKYVPFERGVGRIVLANFEGDSEVLCNYLMIPDSWRTGTGVTSKFEMTDCPPSLEEFARNVTKASGVYLNGIDYIESNNRYILLENNTVPNLRVPYHYLGIDVLSLFVKHVERNATRILE